jgi:ABC-type nitrate/sulfonate/bicarbonate transport system substrate-binding protein
MSNRPNEAYAAVAAGLDEAINFINTDTREAAEIFLKKEPFPGTRDELVEMMQGKTADELSFNSTPNMTKLFTDFMYKSGTLKNLPGSWKDIWFETIGRRPAADRGGAAPFLAGAMTCRPLVPCV